MPRPSITGSTHRLTELVYGAVTAMLANSAMTGGHASRWIGSTVIIVVGAVAVALAHSYSSLISMRIASGHRLAVSD